KVGSNNGSIVRPVPGSPARIGNKGHPLLYRRRRGSAAPAACSGNSLTAVTQQAFISLPPPRAARRRSVQRREHATRQLPAHESHSRPAERQGGGGPAPQP